MTNQIVLQEAAEYADVESDVRQGKLHFWIDDQWVDVSDMTLNQVLEILSN